MFKVLAMLMAAYVTRALVTRVVYAKAGIRGRTYHRNEQPFEYWSAIGAYTVLTLALAFWF